MAQISLEQAFWPAELADESWKRILCLSRGRQVVLPPLSVPYVAILLQLLLPAARDMHFICVIF